MLQIPRDGQQEPLKLNASSSSLGRGTNLRLNVMDNMVECPAEAHELDNTFNPSSQGPYGPGYHDCDWCDNEGEVTEEVYEEWVEWKKQVEINQKNAKLVREIKKGSKINYE